MNMVTQYILGWSVPATICLLVGLALMIYEMFTPGMGFPALLGALALLAAVILRADSLRTALITLLEKAQNGIDGKTGTRIAC